MIKNTFHFINGNRKYHANKKTLEKLSKDFFTGAIWKDHDTKQYLAKDATILKVPEDVYDKHKDIFMVLIYNTKKL